MNEIENVKRICKERKIAISTLEKACGFCNGYIGQLKKGVFPSDRLLKISDYLGVPLSELSPEAAKLESIWNDDDHVSIPSDVLQVLKGPYKNHLLKYAAKLLELQKMEEEIK